MTDGRQITRTPSLETVIDVALTDLKTKFRVAMPARIETYDPIKQKANVQPLIQESFLDDEGNNVVESLPVISDVPVVFPRGGGFYLTFPLAAGDHVLLICCDRSLDKFATGDGEETDPVDLRMHELTDCVAIPGFYPFAKAIADPVDVDVVLGKEGGGMAAHFKDGEIELLIGGAPSHPIALADKLQTWILAHTHPTGTGPSGTPIQPWDATINATKFKVSEG